VRSFTPCRDIGMSHTDVMRTSVDVPDHLLALARARAAAERTTLREILIASLGQYLLGGPAAKAGDSAVTPWQVPVSPHAAGGMFANIDPTDSSALLELE